MENKVAQKIAFIGTGVMGAPMARHLAQNGHKVKVYNRTLSKAKALVPLCELADNLIECVKDADYVFTILGFPQDVEETYLGENGIIKNCKDGALLIDMTTSSPSLAKKIAEEAKLHTGKSCKKIRVMDSPVTGGDKGAIEGTLSIMVGGLQADFDEVLPLLECMGKTITYMGQNGAGQHAKLANQISIAGCLVGCAEALSYAKKQGLSPASLLRVINGGSASSWQSQNNGPKMLNADYKPGFFLKHFTKDLRLGQQEGKDLALPLSASVLKMYEQLLENFADCGTQAIFEFYETEDGEKNK